MGTLNHRLMSPETGQLTRGVDSIVMKNCDPFECKSITAWGRYCRKEAYYKGPSRIKIYTLWNFWYIPLYIRGFLYGKLRISGLAFSIERRNGG